MRVIRGSGDSYACEGISAHSGNQTVHEDDMELLTMKNLPVGTKVRVKSDLSHLNKYDGNSVVSEMEKLAGELVTIDSKYLDMYGYMIEECAYRWTYDMFESDEVYFPLTKENVRIGMEVLFTNPFHNVNPKVVKITSFYEEWVGFEDVDIQWLYCRFLIPCKFHIDEVVDKPVESAKEVEPNKLKAGDEVICVENTGFYEKYFTHGKKYTIIKAYLCNGDEFVTVTSNNGEVDCYAYRFKKITLESLIEKVSTLEEIIKKRDQEITKLKSKIESLEEKLDDISELADY